MTQEHQTDEPKDEQQENGAEPQGEQAENAGQETLYYYSANRYWMGNRNGTRRIHHKSIACRIGARIKPQNRISGKMDDTFPCRACAAGMRR